MNETTEVTQLRLDQRRRWRAGERVLVETYLAHQPALAADTEGLLDLIYNEIVLREELGEKPRYEEYLGRFPQFEDQLRRQFDVHEAIAEGSLTPLTSGAPVLTRPPRPMFRSPFREGAAVGGHEILKELGRGGMGVVYLARHVRLNRLVALKVILAGSHASAGEQSRFQREAEAAARLQHPHIVQIYEVGEHDGCPFLSLELVDGPTLETVLADGPPPARQAAALVQTLAQAMAYAHQRDIVHRDLKPGNVLLMRSREAPPNPESSSYDLAGEDPPAGSAPPDEAHLDEFVPKITDFGLAKFLNAPDRQTQSGMFLGTPSYMAPEQAGGNHRSVGPAADTYALGAMLYELLTGRPPFLASSLPALLDLLRTREAVPVRRLRPRVPRDLETICAKCLEKDPGQRYASAADLAEDLRRFREGEPIQARPAGAWERLSKWVRRRPTAAALVAVSTAALVALAVFIPWHFAEAQAAREQERERGQLARLRFEEFQRLKEEAFFHGFYGIFLPDVDLLANLRATRVIVDQALELAGMEVEDADGPVLAPFGPPSDQAEVAEGCYQLLLTLAAVQEQPGPQDTPADRRRRIRQALAFLDRAAGMAAPTQAYHLRRARYLAQLGQPEEARHERDQARTTRPANRLDFVLLGSELLQQGLWKDARASFEQALRRQPDDFWSHFLLGECLLNQGLLPEAETHLAECLRQRPDFVWNYVALATLHEKPKTAKGLEAAAADYSRALELTPNEDAQYLLYVNRGLVRFDQEKYADAEGDLLQAIAIQPGHYRAYVNLAQLYQDRHRFAESEQLLEKAMRLPLPHRVRAECHVAHARNLYAVKKYEESVTACDTALRILPEYAPAHFQRGQTFLELRRYAAALAAFDRYLAVGGVGEFDLYFGRGRARLQRGDYLGARDEYTRALECRRVAPEQAAEAHLHRGWSYYFAEAWKPAARDFEQALSLDPDNADAYTGRGLARVMQGNYRLAVADAREALDRQPAIPRLLHNLACLFALAADRAKADLNAPDREVLAARYREQALSAVRQALAQLPPEERAPFWREQVTGDKALNSIRGCPEFKRFEEQYAADGPKRDK
jgi:serine/threonine protein kinase/Tfp pilus assembly protein PilF